MSRSRDLEWKGDARPIRAAFALAVVLLAAVCTSCGRGPSSKEIEQARKDGHSVFLWSPSGRLTLPGRGTAAFPVNFIRLRPEVAADCALVSHYTFSGESGPGSRTTVNTTTYHDGKPITTSEKGEIVCNLDLGERTFSGETTISVHVIDRRPGRGNETPGKIISNTITTPVRFQ